MAHWLSQGAVKVLSVVISLHWGRVPFHTHAWVAGRSSSSQVVGLRASVPCYLLARHSCFLSRGPLHRASQDTATGFPQSWKVLVGRKTEARVCHLISEVTCHFGHILFIRSRSHSRQGMVQGCEYQEAGMAGSRLRSLLPQAFLFLY